MKKKVLFLLPTLDAGGAENYALRVVNHYKDEFDFSVLSVKLRKGDLHDNFEKVGAKIFYMSIGYLDIKKVKAFYGFLKSEGFDTICTFNGNFGGLPIAIAKKAGIPNRMAFYRRSTNAFGNNFFKKKYNDFANFLIRKNATGILSNSQAAFDNFHKKYYRNDARYKVIPNGSDAAKFDISISKKEAAAKLGIDENTFIVGHVGRFDPAKNHNTIFKVAAKVISENPNVLFLFCGKDTDSDVFKAKLKENGIIDNCITLGLRNDLEIVYKAMDVFYFPSVTEGQPNALIEAMLSDLPVITADIASISEALPENHQHMVFNPLEVNSVADLILDFSRKQIDENKFKCAAWARVKFDLDKNLNLFKELL
ncbi:hypothetical protein HYN48_00240 [Flavobacterium magnum]|uniref:Uncharacterized protein n=1 Tax=Flavobacterium magnum TaxID=2162713 RepID=A0A2S0RAP8_9FLAO|nr:glycosyltransferase [Flavobacterium magnum]AWA28634.1 hypothetical protein HYN48_00240 [Flavobacterium magnum]